MRCIALPPFAIFAARTRTKAPLPLLRCPQMRPPPCNTPPPSMVKQGAKGRISADYQPPAPTSTSQGGWSRCVGRGTFTSTEVYAGLSEGFLESQVTRAEALVASQCHRKAQDETWEVEGCAGKEWGVMVIVLDLFMRLPVPLQGSPTIITYEPDAKAGQAVQGGSFCLLAQFKCAHSAPASGNRPAFDLMLVRPLSHPRNAPGSLCCDLVIVAERH